MTPLACDHCGTELSSDMLVCPACATLVHRTTLARLADEARRATETGDDALARQHWTYALQLLPRHAPQHAVITARLQALTPAVTATIADRPSSPPAPATWWRRGLGGLAAAVFLLLGKLKFLLLGLTKAGTFLSMFAFLGVYWTVYGWPLAIGVVSGIYIHEMGHVAMLRRLGIDAGAPLFVPGVGAFVMLKQRVEDPLTNARIGLAGPVWGVGAAIAALAMYFVTGAPVWLAIAHVTGFVNLFNLLPVWQLDGSRGIHVLSRNERWLLVGVMLMAFILTSQRLVVILAAVAAWRAWRTRPGPGSGRTLATFSLLILVLAAISSGVAPEAAN